MTPRPTIVGIQYLRGIAAMMVVLFHSRNYFHGAEWPEWTGIGARGVDIFFVISGFIMAYTTQIPDASPPSLRDNALRAHDFMLRRLLRIVPLYWLALAWTAKHELHHGTGDLNLLFDFLFVPHYTSTLPRSIFPVLVPGWTINYEMIFYAIFAASMLLGRRGLAVTVVVILGLCTLGQVFRFDSAIAHFYTEEILCEFALGIFVFKIINRPPPQWASTPWLLYAAIPLAAGALALDRNIVSNAISAAVILLATVAIFRFATTQHRVLTALGDASYAIYLFHPASFSYSRTLLGWLDADALPMVARIPVVLAFQAVFAAGIGVLIHTALEKPLLGVGHQLIARWDAFIVGRRSAATAEAVDRAARNGRSNDASSATN